MCIFCIDGLDTCQNPLSECEVLILLLWYSNPRSGGYEGRGGGTYYASRDFVQGKLLYTERQPSGLAQMEHVKGMHAP